MPVGTNFTINLNFGDANGPTIAGKTIVVAPNTGNNAVQLNQEVLANTSVVATSVPGTSTQDVAISNTPITVANILAMGFSCVLVNSNGNANTPQCYVKLKHAMTSTDYVFPLIPGQTITYLPVASKDANGNTMNTSGCTLGVPVQFTNTTITQITCTPDKVSDLQILGTIEVSL